MNFWGTWRRSRWVALLVNTALCAILAGPMLALAGQAAINPVTPENPSNIEIEPAIALNASSTESLTKDVRRTVLKNGMVVLTKEVHNAPVATVQVWYKIGSRNEAPGVNGIAHQLEHMLFKGTKTRPVQFGRLLSALGSDFNAFTSYDHTVYYETLERNKIASALALEADRMQNAIIDPKLLDGEKRVVISELQGNENSAAYRLGKAVQELALPDSPYGLSVGGTKADVETFTEPQVRSYYSSYYSPNNAALVLVGDFDTNKILADVRRIMEPIPSRPITVKTPVAAPRVVKSRTITLREPGSNALINAVYPLPSASDPDVPALDVMNYILSVGRSSRLYQQLVETGKVSSVSAGAANLAGSGWYEYSATTDPGKPLAQIDKVIQAEISKIQKTSASKVEIDRAKSQLRAGYLLSYRDIGSQARQLGNDETTSGDYQFTDKYLANVQKVTAADVQRVASKYLIPSKRVLGFFEPDNSKGKPAGGGTGHNAAANLGAPLDPSELQKYLPTAPVDSLASNQSLPQASTLANGLKILLLRDPSSPTVTLQGNITAGTEFDSTAKAGVASLTASNLMNGTTSKSALAIAKGLENRGASLGFSASREGVTIGGNALDEDLPILVQTLGDVLQNATFPAKDFANSQQRALTALQAELDNPSSVARRRFQQTIYPQNHPFTNFPTLASLKSISRQELAQFYGQLYQPQNTQIALVGNFDPAKAKQLLEKTFGNWQSKKKESRTLTYAEPQLPAKNVVIQPTIVGKTQSVTIMGNKAINRQDPRFYAALVLNQVLGGDTLSSRLGTEIRDRLGLTYGIYSSFAAGKRQGTFLISMQTDPNNAKLAVEKSIELIRDVKNKGLSAAEVDNAKQSIASNYTVELGSADDVAGTSLSNLVYGLPENEIREFPKKIRSVTVAQVNQAAKELLHPDNFVVITVGPPLGTKSNGKPEEAKPVAPTEGNPEETVPPASEKSNKSPEKVDSQPVTPPATSETQPNTENQTKPDVVTPESPSPATN
jgi:zinc protease